MHAGRQVLLSGSDTEGAPEPAYAPKSPEYDENEVNMLPKQILIVFRLLISIVKAFMKLRITAKVKNKIKK